jgi:general stress protein 26
MSNIENLDKNEGIIKLKKMVDDVKFCFFCTHLNNYNGATSTIMTAQSVDEEGNMWFFSGLNSDRNRDINLNKNIQLYFSSPEKNAYLAVNSEAEIILDKVKMKELWNPILKIWFKDGIEDTNISLIKASTKNAYYWDSEGGKMVNFIKMIGSLITGNDFVDTVEGEIKI